MMTKKSKGFTFVELMVVITIAALTFGAITVSFASVSKKSRDSRRKADLESIRQALELCRSYSGSYPAALGTSIACTSGGTTQTYMSVVPKDPKSGSSYTYTQTATGYTIQSNEMESVTNPYTLTNP